MKPRTLLVSALSMTVSGLALLSACADTISAGTDPPPSPAPAPSFSEPDSAPTALPDAGMCNAYDCPAPYVTCPHKLGLCNTNLQTDFENCGACDKPCELPGTGASEHARIFCIEGQCRVECKNMRGDCNGKAEDGCEADLETDQANCGACGNACKAGEICWRAACGCPPGHAQCEDTCARVESDPSNCGACGNVCTAPDADAGSAGWPCGPGVSPPHWGPICASSSCTLGCAEGTANCNDDLCGDGCETNLRSDPQNCGACGHACLPEQGCVQGTCQCQDSRLAYCGECVNLLTDSQNCGSCGNVCPGYDGQRILDRKGGNPTCELGRCSYYCPPGRADCDHRIDNGCEVDLMVDPLNCGGCGIQCDLDGGQPCAAGQCLTKPCEGPDAGGVF